MKTLLQLIYISCLLAGSQISQAASFVFDLNCYEDGKSACSTTTPSSTWGTVSITDTNINEVSLTVELIGDSVKFSDLFLNFNPDNKTDVLTDQNGVEYEIDQNEFTLAPWKNSEFDVGQDDSPSKGFSSDANPYTFILTGNGDFSARDFVYLSDGNPKLYLGLHIQSCGSDPITPYCDPNGGSIKVGSTEYKEFPGPTVVPVPAALWLFGSGFLGMLGLVGMRQSQA